MGAAYCVLQIITADGRVYEHPLRKPETTLGQHADNDIVLAAPQIAGRHLLFRLERATVRVTHLGESEALHNGRLLRPNRATPLRSGDVLALGRVSVRLLIAPQRASYWPAVALIVALLSLALNVGLLLRLSRMAQAGGALLGEVAPAVEALLVQGVDVPVRLAQTVPISAAIPIRQDLTVPIRQDVPINTMVAAQVLIPVINQQVTLNIPVQTTVPIAVDVPVHVDQTVLVQADVPVDIAVTAHVNLKDVQAGVSLEKVREWLERLRALF